jgi:hypothetical protein
MNPTGTRRRSSLLALAAGLGLSFSGAFAQDAKPASPLKGPTVTDRNVPGSPEDFGMGANRRFGDRVPPEVFRRAIGVLTAEDAPADLRATPEQRAKFKEMVEGFEDSVRSYRKSHAKKIEELRKAAGDLRPGERPGQRRQQPGRDDEMKAQAELTPEQQKAREEARAKLRELMAGAPKIEDVYTKVWTELSDPQRTAVQAELDKWREEQAKKREDDYVRRQMDKKKPVQRAAARPGAEPRPGADEMMAPKADARPGATGEERTTENPRIAARRERLMRIFSQLTPEEQEQLLQRLEERLRDRRGRTSPGAEEQKPAADPDRVKVPKPDDDKK